MYLASDYSHPTSRGRRCRIRVYLPEEERDSPVVICSELPAQQLEGAFAQAIEPSQVSTMAREDLERLVLEKPEVSLRMMRVLSERLRRYETRVEDVTMKDVRSRLAGIIVLLVESEGVTSVTGYRIPAHYTHERLGTMIGANRVAVTRAFGLLQDEGVVELRRRLIYVTDIEALRQVAGYGDFQEAKFT